MAFDVMVNDECIILAIVKTERGGGLYFLGFKQGEVAKALHENVVDDNGPRMAAKRAKRERYDRPDGIMYAHGR